jgi:hypothetical protein
VSFSGVAHEISDIQLGELQKTIFCFHFDVARIVNVLIFTHHGFLKILDLIYLQCSGNFTFILVRSFHSKSTQPTPQPFHIHRI